jgi:hypothetical protein
VLFFYFVPVTTRKHVITKLIRPSIVFVNTFTTFQLAFRLIGCFIASLPLVTSTVNKITLLDSKTRHLLVARPRGCCDGNKIEL